MTNRENPPGSRSIKQNKTGYKPAAADQTKKMGVARFIRARTGETRRAAFTLAQTQPLSSAFTGLLPLQVFVISAVFSAVVIAGFLVPIGLANFVHISLLSLFCFAIGFRLLILVVHFWPEQMAVQGDVQVHNQQIWPVYTLLLPLYKEARILPSLVDSIAKLEYPTEKLDIKLLLEADDVETLAVARTLHLGAHWEVIVVPDIGPRTKPKALNVGLARAKGSFVTIYDAEDRPHPSQLRAAVQAFDRGRAQLACVQAPLGYYNRDKNWLTRQFSLEYNAQFQVVLPALVRLGIAFPLGGTSNHFRRRALDEIGGWDPYNVTEDADLGFRLSKNGWCAGVILPPTLEEATAKVRPWVGQRSRWIKGFVQTAIVHLRGGTPGGCAKHALGFFAVLGLAIFSAFSHAFLLASAIVCFVCWPFGGEPIAVMDICVAILGIFMAWLLLWAGSKREFDTKQAHPWTLFSSLAYWPLQTWAAMIAAKELVHKPFHWEKTDHGHSLE